MKKFAFLLGITLTTSLAYASNIVIADMNKVIQTSSQMVEIQSELDKTFSSRHKAIMAKMQQAKSDNEHLLKDGNIMKADEREALTNKINGARQYIMTDQAKFQQDYEKARTAALSTLMSKINKVTATLAKNKHYDMILNRMAAPFASNSLDVTDNIIALLKKEG